jgi:hypothetical protein
MNGGAQEGAAVHGNRRSATCRGRLGKPQWPVAVGVELGELAEKCSRSGQSPASASGATPVVGGFRTPASGSRNGMLISGSPALPRISLTSATRPGRCSGSRCRRRRRDAAGRCGRESRGRAMTGGAASQPGQRVPDAESAQQPALVSVGDGVRAGGADASAVRGYQKRQSTRFEHRAEITAAYGCGVARRGGRAEQRWQPARATNKLSLVDKIGFILVFPNDRYRRSVMSIDEGDPEPVGGVPL